MSPSSNWKLMAFTGTCQDKMKLLFMMYDFDKSGSLNREEVAGMIRYNKIYIYRFMCNLYKCTYNRGIDVKMLLVRSLMEIANTSLSPEEVSNLVDQMFVSSGLERRSSLKFSGMCLQQ